ncbi:MAG: hypothetical protein KG003_16215 [Bacteroidetes bacterium]|nr:hypothetical protein [Bacteroidota bacterium]
MSALFFGCRVKNIHLYEDRKALKHKLIYNSELNLVTIEHGFLISRDQMKTIYTDSFRLKIDELITVENTIKPKVEFRSNAIIGRDTICNWYFGHIYPVRKSKFMDKIVIDSWAKSDVYGKYYFLRQWIYVDTSRNDSAIYGLYQFEEFAYHPVLQKLYSFKNATNFMSDKFEYRRDSAELFFLFYNDLKENGYKRRILNKYNKKFKII